MVTHTLVSVHGVDGVDGVDAVKNKKSDARVLRAVVAIYLQISMPPTHLRRVRARLCLVHHLRLCLVHHLRRVRARLFLVHQYLAV